MPRRSSALSSGYTQLNKAREDVVEAKLSFPGGVPKAVRVTGPDGIETPSQISGGKVLFLAKAPSVGYAVYDVQPAETPAVSPILKVTESTVRSPDRVAPLPIAA